jgi:WD40 repeat protein
MFRAANFPVKDVVTALAGEPGYPKTLAVGYQEEGIDLLELPNGRVRRSLAYQGEVYALAWSHDGAMLAAGGLGEDVFVWDTASGDLVAVYKGHAMAVVDLEFSPDGKWIASTGGDSVHVWNPLNGAIRLKYEGHTSYPTCAVWAASGDHIASGEMLGQIHVWSVQAGCAITTYLGQAVIPFRHEHKPAEFFAVKAIAFSPSGNLVASAQANEGETGGTLHVWEAATGRPVLQYPGHPYGISWSQRGLLWLYERTLIAVDTEGSAYDFSLVNDGWNWQKRRGQGTGYASHWIKSTQLLTTSITSSVIRSWDIARDDGGLMSNTTPVDEREKIGALLSTGGMEVSEIVARTVAQFVENLQEHEGLRTLAEAAIRLDELAYTAGAVASSPARTWSCSGRFDSSLFGISFAKQESACRAYLGCVLHDLDKTLGQGFSVEDAVQVVRDIATYASLVHSRMKSAM